MEKKKPDMKKKTLNLKWHFKVFEKGEFECSSEQLPSI